MSDAVGGVERAVPICKCSNLALKPFYSPATLWELAKAKQFPFPNPLPEYVQDAQDFADFLKMRDNGNLPEFLDKFDYMLPLVSF